MFFVLSKILLFLINPFYWIVFCAFLFYFSKNLKAKKIWKYLGIFIFLFFSNYKIYSLCMLAWQPKAEPQQHSKQYELGIILGGMSGADVNGNSFFSETSDRFIQTCKLYHTGVIHKILISGGDGSLMQNKPKEAFFLLKEFTAQNIADTNLLVEPMSKSTYESAVAAKNLLDSLHYKPPYLLITSAIHMKRAKATFEKAGLQVDIHTANFDVINYPISWDSYIIPKTKVLAEWQYLLKEMVGYVVYKATGKA